MNEFMLGAYWKPRPESIEQCADRLLACMTEIRECDPVFAHWYQTGRSRKDALKHEIDVQNRAEVTALLDKGRNRNFYEEAIENLGFGVGIWNGGNPGKEVGLGVHCGMYRISPDPKGGLSNCVTLSFPEDLGELSDSIKVSRILSVVASCWEPDWAGVFSHAAMNTRDWERKPFVDWMVYIPTMIADVPPPSAVTHFPNGGSLIIVQPTPPAVDNAEAQERIRAIDAVIREHCT